MICMQGTYFRIQTDWMQFHFMSSSIDVMDCLVCGRMAGVCGRGLEVYNEMVLRPDDLDYHYVL